MPREATQFKPGHKPTHKNRGATPGRKIERQMTPRQAVFVENYLKSGNGRAAALAAGYSESSAHSRASDFLRKPGPVLDVINAARRVVAQKGAFDLERLMTELNEGAEFARETGNATALARFVELKAKACGLLVERIDSRQVGAFEINISGIDGPVRLSQPQPKVVNNDDGGDIFS